MFSILTILKNPHSAMRNVDSKFSFATAGLILFSAVLSNSSAEAASLVIPTTTINGIDGFSAPSFTVTSNFLGTDTISLDVSGTVDLASDFASGGGYVVNAAGVLIQRSVFGDPVGGARVGPNNINFGALLLGNNTIGFRQLFPTNAVNGLGNSAPPMNLSLTDVSLSSIFGSGLNSGTVLQFRVNDSDSSNNLGTFTVGTPISQPTVIPEPFTIVGTLIGGTAALRMRKKLKADKA